MSDTAWTVLWILGGLMVYALGFVAAVAIKTKTCRKAPYHTDCDHIWDEPIAIFWPVVVTLFAVTAPLWVPLVLIVKTSRRVEARIKENQKTTARALR